MGYNPLLDFQEVDAIKAAIDRWLVWNDPGPNGQGPDPAEYTAVKLLRSRISPLQEVATDGNIFADSDSQEEIPGKDIILGATDCDSVRKILQEVRARGINTYFLEGIQDKIRDVIAITRGGCVCLPGTR